MKLFPQRLRLPVLACYWATGLIIALTYLREDFARSTPGDPGRDEPRDPGGLFGSDRLLRPASWALVMVQTSIYDKCCHKKARSLDLSTLAIFPLLNGLAETAIFVAVFKAGKQLTDRYGSCSGWLTSLGGFVPYYAFVALIHVHMWIRILPDHLSSEPSARLYRRLMIAANSLVAAAWALLYLSLDLWTVVQQHAAIDCALVLSLHYSMWG
jgi:hypothetical protein